MERFYDPVIEANERLRDALAQLKKSRLIQKVLMDISKTLSQGASYEQTLRIMVEAISALFPEAYFLVQLTDPISLTLTNAESHGPLINGIPERIFVSRSAVEKTGLELEPDSSRQVEVVDCCPALFKETDHVIHIPLVARSQLFGTIHLEDNARCALGDDDEVLLISLANQLALGIRNQRLLQETSYLKDYLANILEQANALIIVTDMNRQILVYNRTMEQLVGFQKSEMLGTDLFQWITIDEQTPLANEITNAVKGVPSPLGVETGMRTREGLLVRIRFHFSALRNREGQVDSLILVGQDLTQMRLLEEQIIQAEKMATLGKLAAGVVHELNNPLTSISIYSEYLLKRMSANKIEHTDVSRMEKILQGAQRIQKLTRDLVSYARPSREEPEPLPPNELLEQGVSFCEHVIRKYDIRVTTDLPPDLPDLIGNRNQLLQLVINLITNACQAMEGGGELSLTSRCVEPNHVELSIADTGSGIPERDLERIFEPFYTTKEAGSGTGLGLSIVSRIVEHHHGDIRVESTIGHGSTFTIRLPLITEQIKPKSAAGG